MSDILACLILDEATAAPLFSHFFDKELKKNPHLISKKLRAGEIRMIHEMGKHVVYSVLIKTELSDTRRLLREFASRVDAIYPDGMKRGEGNFADFVILQNIVKEVF